MRYATVPVVVLALAVGTGAYAYVNPAITHEHPLYRVKHAVEQVEGAFAFTARAQARFESRIMARRVLELEMLVARGEMDGEVSDEIARTHERAISAAAEVKDEAARDAVIVRIERNADRHVEVLEKIEARTPEEAEKTLEQVIERQEQVLERRLEHVDALREERVARQLERIEKLEALRDQAFAEKEAREEAIENEEIEAGEGDPPPLSSPFPKGGGSEGGGSVTRESPDQLRTFVAPEREIQVDEVRQ